MGTVYLLHFDTKLAHAQHYIGYCTGDVQRRLDRHRAGRGARLMAAVTARGIEWRLVRTWPGGRVRERQLKAQGGAARLCPVCRETRRAVGR